MSLEQWPVEALGDLCDTITKGSSPKWQGFSYVDKPGILFVTSENVGENQMLFRKTKYVEEAFNEKDSRSILKRGDVLTNLVGASIGRTAIFDRDDVANINQAVGILRCKPDLLFNEYLAYLLNSPVFKEIMHDNEVNNARANLSLAFFKQLQVPLPDLAEQKRIVSILDEAFSAIAKAKENAEKNLLGARELFESYLNRVFTQQGPGWQEKKLGELAEFKNGLNFNKNSSGQTLPVVGVGDFQDYFYAPIDQLETATIDGELEANYAIRKDDILTVRSNGSKHLIGRCMLVPDVYETTSYSGFVIRIRFDTELLHPRFLLHYMKCRQTVDVLTRGGGGANIQNINQGKLSALKVTFPSCSAEQERLADLLDEQSSQAEQLETIYTQKLANLDELKQSLLQKAFTGQLTTATLDEVFA